jgi:predicted DNA-binding protein
MPTAKSRINISLPDEVKDALQRLAKRDRLPEATKAARLLEVALELEEDLAWVKIVEARDKKSAKFVSHAQAWK